MLHFSKMSHIQFSKNLDKISTTLTVSPHHLNVSCDFLSKEYRHPRKHHRKEPHFAFATL